VTPSTSNIAAVSSAFTVPSAGLVPPGFAATYDPEGDPTQIDLSPGVVNEATPSAVAADGQSFNDCAYAQTCAAP
jgi:hypothetical protein